MYWKSEADNEYYSSSNRTKAIDCLDLEPVYIVFFQNKIAILYKIKEFSSQRNISTSEGFDS